MKKLIVMFVCLFITATLLFAGCKQSETTTTDETESTPTTQKETEAVEETSSTSDSIVTPVGTFPIVSEPVTLTFFSPIRATIEDIATNDFTLWYEEKTGVHIEWNLAPTDEYATKLNLILASGDYPDVINGKSAIGSANESQYGAEEGILVAVNDLMDEWCPNLTQFLTEIDGFGAITNLDGNIYGFPSYNSCYHCENAQRMWINSGWLDNLGLEAPETTDELYEVLLAFKNDDPNGNGIQDEIPMSSFLGGWNTSLDGFLMNPFIYSTSAALEDMKLRVSAEGVVDSIADKEEYREGLRYLNMLYSEGLIDQNALTQSRDQARALVADPEQDILGMMPEGTMIQIIDTAANNETYARYEAIAPLEGPTGLRQAPTFPSTPISATTCITIACEYPEVVARWVDDFYDFYSDDAYLTAVSRQFGIEGVDWKWADAGVVGLDGVSPAMYEFITTPDQPSQNHCWENTLGPYVWPNEMRLGMPRDLSKSLYATDMVDPLLYVVSKELMVPYATDEYIALPPIKYTSEETTEMSTLEPELKKYIGESFAKFVVGDMSLDTDWDSYISGLESIGLARYLEIVQAGYTSQYGQ